MGALCDRFNIFRGDLIDELQRISEKNTGYNKQQSIG